MCDGHLQVEVVIDYGPDVDFSGADAAPRSVVSVGGGAWTIGENRQMIAEHGAFTIWLDAPFELCWKRIAGGREVRPLARSLEMTQRLYAERQPIYEAADARVTVNENESVAEIATKVASLVFGAEPNS